MAQSWKQRFFCTAQECLPISTAILEAPWPRCNSLVPEGKIRLKVEDNGVGIPAEKLDEVTSPGIQGVGVRGMRDRLRQLGSSLDIRSDDNRTTVEAKLP